MPSILGEGVQFVNRRVHLLADDRKSDKASESGNVYNRFNPQHAGSSKKSPGVRGACLKTQCCRTDIVPIKAIALLGESRTTIGKGRAT